MTFAAKIHEEQHQLNVNGQELLVQVHTTKFVGYKLMTFIRCARLRTDVDFECYHHNSSQDFMLNLSSNYNGRITENMIKRHLQEYKQSFDDIVAQIQNYYSHA